MNSESFHDDAQTEIQGLKARIAQVWVMREDAKKALETGATSFREGMRQLEATDRELSELDMRFKRLWDSANGRAPATHKETP